MASEEDGEPSLLSSGVSVSRGHQSGCLGESLLTKRNSGSPIQQRDATAYASRENELKRESALATIKRASPHRAHSSCMGSPHFPGCDCSGDGCFMVEPKQTPLRTGNEKPTAQKTPTRPLPMPEAFPAKLA